MKITCRTAVDILPIEIENLVVKIYISTLCECVTHLKEFCEFVEV